MIARPAWSRGTPTRVFVIAAALGLASGCDASLFAPGAGSHIEIEGVVAPYIVEDRPLCVPFARDWQGDPQTFDLVALPDRVTWKVDRGLVKDGKPLVRLGGRARVTGTVGSERRECPGIPLTVEGIEPLSGDQ
jgi:hypothetical protein